MVIAYINLKQPHSAITWHFSQFIIRKQCFWLWSSIKIVSFFTIEVEQFLKPVLKSNNSQEDSQEKPLSNGMSNWRKHFYFPNIQNAVAERLIHQEIGFWNNQNCKGDHFFILWYPVKKSWMHLGAVISRLVWIAHPISHRTDWAILELFAHSNLSSSLHSYLYLQQDFPADLSCFIGLSWFCIWSWYLYVKHWCVITKGISIYWTVTHLLDSDSSML